jgi:hypothetical protein
MSKLNDILDAIVTKETDAAATIGENALTVVKRKLPKREEADAAYQVTVNGAELVDRVQRIAFGNQFKVTYLVLVTLITPNDLDAALNLDEHAAWREAARARYMATTPLAGLGIQQIDVTPAPFLDRAALSAAYDYNQLALEITVYESR